MKWRSVCGLIAVLLLASPTARAQAPAQDANATPPAATTPVQQFTLDDLGERAEDVAAQLRDMTEALADQTRFAELDARVTHFRRRVGDRWSETDRLLSGSLRRGPLETLASSWRALRIELLQIRADVDAHLDQRKADLASIDRLKENWTWTLDHATASGAPATVLDRIQDTIAAIDGTRTQVDARHSQLLVLQDAVSRAMQACDDATSRIADARKKAISRILADNEPPLWRSQGPLPIAAAGATRSASRHPGVGAGIEAVKIYLQAYRSGVIATGLIALFFYWILYRERGRAKRAAGSGAALPDFVVYAFQSPIATAILLTLVVSRPFRPEPPAALRSLILVVGLPAALMVLRPVLESRLMRACYAFGVLFVADLVRPLLALHPRAEQWMLLVEMAAAAGLMLWTASALAASAGRLATSSRWLGRFGRHALAAGGLAAAVASLAALDGYLELADFLGGGALAVVFLAIGVLAFRIAAGGMIWLALVESPLARLRAVDRNRVRMEAGLGRALDVTSFALWLAFTLQSFELLDPTIAGINSLLDARLQAGELNIAVGRVVGFFAVIGIAWLTTRIAIFALEEDVYPRMRLARGVPYAISTMVRYGLLLAGFFAALAMLGLDLTRLTVLVSAFGLGLGFGMQQIINNFVSGLILLFERPVQVGDLVQMKDLNGEVRRIGIRSSTIRTPDGAEVIIPNSELIQNDVTNWTLSDRRRRVTFDIGVAYGVEAERVLALLVAIASRDPRVVTNPAPDALFVGFGASSLDFQLRFWTDEPLWMRLKSDIGVALQTALREAGIEVPFTTITLQTDLAAARSGSAR